MRRSIQAQYPVQMSKPTEATEDGRLVSGVLAKDRKVTAEFVAQCADWIYPFVRRRLVPRAELVEDVMQEVLFAAWQALPNFRGDAPLRSWVMGIARHKLEDYYRKKIRELEISEEDDSLPDQGAGPAFDERLDSWAQRKRVQRTLAKLPEAYALALIWQYRDEKSIREMAQLTGKTEKAMERLLARARASFRRRWNDGEI
jgi:RNA polymerase sigma-70 factor, ECF subfamily